MLEDSEREGRGESEQGNIGGRESRRAARTWTEKDEK